MALLLAAPADAQVNRRPTPEPIVTAENDTWYRLAEPIVVNGDLYVPDGPITFFDGETMVRTGHYNGVPLYADTTRPPYRVVFVPIGRGLMHPYELARDADLRDGAVRPAALPRTGGALPMAPAPPTRVPGPIGDVTVVTPEPGAVGTAGRAAAPVLTTTTDVVPRVRADQPAIITIPSAEGNDGVWLRFMDAIWVSAGPAVPLQPSEFVIVGEYAGFAVFARRSLEEDRIYLPTVPGLVAPFRLKP